MCGSVKQSETQLHCIVHVLLFGFVFCLCFVCVNSSRFGGSELHNTAAILGGTVAQAVMKVILRQFFTFNHTFIFNGIHCSGDVITL